jgi:tetratricopeptide (TPR) repeat protein
MNRLRLFWDDEDKKKHLREQTIKRERQVGTVLMLGLFSMFPIVVLACNDDATRVSEQASAPPASVDARPATSRTTPVAVTPEPEIIEQVSMVPNNPTFGDGELAFAEHRYGDAVEIFSIWSNKNPDTPWGHYMKGLSALRAKRYVESENGFIDALTVDPQHLKSLRNVSRLYLATDRVEEAFQDIQFAIEIDPESGESYRLLALAQDRLGLVDDALDSYQHALTLDREDAWSMNNIGLIYIQKQQYDLAVEPLARATQLREDVPVFYNNLGIALERTGYAGDAIESFRRTLELDPNHERAAVSLERVESRDSIDVFVADLEQFAQSFADRIDTWVNPSVSSTVKFEQETGAEVIDAPVTDDAPTSVEPTPVSEDEFGEISSAFIRDLRLLTARD